jgi:hypothetical protein
MLLGSRPSAETHVSEKVRRLHLQSLPSTAVLQFDATTRLLAAGMAPLFWLQRLDIQRIDNTTSFCYPTNTERNPVFSSKK